MQRDTERCACDTTAPANGICPQELPSVLRTFAEPGRVRRLDATNNRLAALPDWLFHRFAGLQQLTLSHNRLSALPPEIGLMTSLKVRYHFLTECTFLIKQRHALEKRGSSGCMS